MSVAEGLGSGFALNLGGIGLAGESDVLGSGQELEMLGREDFVLVAVAVMVVLVPI